MQKSPGLERPGRVVGLTELQGINTQFGRLFPQSCSHFLYRSSAIRTSFDVVARHPAFTLRSFVYQPLSADQNELIIGDLRHRFRPLARLMFDQRHAGIDPQKKPPRGRGLVKKEPHEDVLVPAATMLIPARRPPQPAIAFMPAIAMSISAPTRLLDEGLLSPSEAGQTARSRQSLSAPRCGERNESTCNSR